MAKKSALKTRIALVLDSSGSMQSIRKEALDMFNQQVRAIKKGAAEVDTKVSLAVFETGVKTIIFNEDVKKLKELTLESYNPDGGTAMYDAVGGAIDALSFLPEASDENTSFLVVIVSDGEENQSKKYNQYDIQKRVLALQATGRWTFSYLGANQDLGKISNDLGILRGNTHAFVASAAGVNSAGVANTIATANYMNSRSMGVKSVNNFYSPENTGLADTSGQSTTKTTK